PVLTSTPVTSSAPEPSCATPGLHAPPACWRQIRPLGSGGFPPSPGSSDQPKWTPGRFPLTLPARIAFDDQLWMTGQTVAYSSLDGLTWQQHAKTNWGERIYHAVVYFKGRLWMYGGLDYASRRFLRDIWTSADGTSWTKVGSAPWSARGGETMVVYRD